MKKLLIFAISFLLFYSCNKTDIYMFDTCYDIPNNKSIDMTNFENKFVEVSLCSGDKIYKYLTITRDFSHIKNRSYLLEIDGGSNDTSYHLTCGGILYMGVILVKDTITEKYDVLAIKPVIDGKVWNTGSNSPIGVFETDDYLKISSNGIDSQPKDDKVNFICIELKIYKNEIY